MSFDDGAADGEPDPHAGALRRVERVEQLVYTLLVDAHAGIPYGQAHSILVLAFGSDQQLPRAVVHAHHRVAGVADQVQDDLLELDPVTGQRRKILGELRMNCDPVSLKVT